MPPEFMAPTKAMLNRAIDAAGSRLAVEAGLDLGTIVNAADTPEQREWDEVVRRDGLKATLAWRDRRYDERLATSGEPDSAPRPSRRRDEPRDSAPRRAPATRPRDSAPRRAPATSPRDSAPTRALVAAPIAGTD